MTLQDTNTALNIQRAVKAAGFSEEFNNVFAAALRNDKTAFEIFECWSKVHPDALTEAVDFLRTTVKDRGPLARALGGAPCVV